MNFAVTLERLRKDAADAALTRNLVPPARRDRFDRVQRCISRLADDVERAMKQANAQ